MLYPRRYLWLLPFSLTVIAPDFILSQHLEVYGSVVDSVTLEPIPFANIRIAGGSGGVAANARGFFALPEIPPGTHKVVVTAVGYISSEKEVTGSAGTTIRL